MILRIWREIKQYLLSVTEKYKIPFEEVELTKKTIRIVQGRNGRTYKAR